MSIPCVPVSSGGLSLAGARALQSVVRRARPRSMSSESSVEMLMSPNAFALTTRTTSRTETSGLV